MGVFLSAEWRHLIMLNYRVPPELLEPLVPAGTRLDSSQGAHWVSVVGFLFLNTRVKGIPVPLHQDFEELNLRFYVRRDEPDTERGVDHRRGVVFIKELVPKAAIAWVARTVYQENYQSLPMRHSLQLAGEHPAPGDRVSYGFKHGGQWGQVACRVASEARPLTPGSHPEFIAEHYWGYAAQSDGGTVEYQVEHPPWAVHEVDEVELSGDLSGVYGPNFSELLTQPPDSAFLARGSEVRVMDGARI